MILRKASLAALALSLPLVVVPSLAEAQTCDPVGRWAYRFEWTGGRCADLPDEGSELIVQKGADAQPQLVDIAGGAGALDRRVSVRAEEGGCRMLLDFDVNQTAYGTAVIAHWTYSLLDKAGKVTCSGSYTHTEGSRHPKRCTQKFNAAGTHGAATGKETAPPVLVQTTQSTTVAGAGAAAPAHKGECPAGQAKSADSAGHCCWAGQAWSASQGRCRGIPSSCPGGMRVDGEGCTGNLQTATGGAQAEADALLGTLQREIESRRGAIDDCWKKAFPDGKGPAGHLRLRLSIRRGGKVDAVSVVEDTLKSEPVASCAVAAAKGWTVAAISSDEVQYEHDFGLGRR
jgi:hypothetical protein